MKTVSDFDQFKALPVKVFESNSSCHFIFYKQHSVRENSESKPLKKTLFLVNVPPQCQKHHLERIFSKYGPVNKIAFHQKPTAGSSVEEKSNYFKLNPPIKGFKVAYVVFKNASSVVKALSANSLETEILHLTDDKTIGVKKWCRSYNDALPELQELEREIERNLRKHQNLIKNTTSTKAEDQDDDGWIKVTRRGKKPGIPLTESRMEKILKKNKKKMSEKELLNFYRFQIKQSKMEHIAQLRKKFEEDKKKIATMKAARKFLPY